MTVLWKLKTAELPPPRPLPAELSTWQIYEREKRRIAQTSKSLDEYEIRVKALIKRLEL